MTLMKKLWQNKKVGDRTAYVLGGLVLGVLALVGMLAKALGESIPAGSASSGTGVGLTLFFLFGAGGMLGGFLGVLLGLPRARYADATSSAAGSDEAGKAAAVPADRRSHYLASLNLVKVSDWLTTIIVGLGLVNLGKVGPWIARLRDDLSEPLGGAPYAGTLGVATLLTAALLSLVLGYVWISIPGRILMEETEGDDDTVPVVTGKTVAEALTVMGRSTFALDVNGADDATIGSQAPSGGAKAARGTVVTARVKSSHSAGGEVEVPAVVGETVATARERLAHVGLPLVGEHAANEHVKRQRPAAGTNAHAGDPVSVTTAP